MGHRVITIGGIDEEHTWFAVVMSLLYKFVEKVFGFDGLKVFDGDVLLFGIRNCSGDFLVRCAMDIGENEIPILIIFNRAHKVIGNSQGDVEVGDSRLAGFTFDKVFHVRVVDA